MGFKKLKLACLISLDVLFTYIYAELKWACKSLDTVALLILSRTRIQE